MGTVSRTFSSFCSMEKKGEREACSEQDLQFLLEQTQKVQAEEVKVCMWKNTDDGYRWEGYGSRRLADGTPNRKSYYRCVNVRAPKSCQAKKVLQEHPDDARVMIVTYKGAHTHEALRPLNLLHPILKLLHCPPPTIDMSIFNLSSPPKDNPPPPPPPSDKKGRYPIEQITSMISRNQDLLGAVGDFLTNNDTTALIDFVARQPGRVSTSAIEKFPPREGAMAIGSRERRDVLGVNERLYSVSEEGDRGPRRPPDLRAPSAFNQPKSLFPNMPSPREGDPVSGLMMDNLFARHLGSQMSPSRIVSVRFFSFRS
eukprot:c7783_g1_i2.p1 GENE.c7783_g1_i2~~c7783_g1_i2.p1  ORF type:complete len:313 (-),score=45.32 c7783_g1_i2:576-1514(-)